MNEKTPVLSDVVNAAGMAGMFLATPVAEPANAPKTATCEEEMNEGMSLRRADPS